MPDLNCPSCGAALSLRSAALPYVVCPSCQTVVLRGEQGAQDVGKSAVLPFDVSPIKLGTMGRAAGSSFTVVGRVRWAWADGSWNEWLLADDDGRHRWLGEAAGQYLLLEESPELLDDPLVAEFAAGRQIALGAMVGDYQAIDVREATCLGGEGDLPFPTPTDWTMASIDFRDPAGGALCIQRDANGVHAYVGLHCTLADLMPRNLRTIEGWTLPASFK